MADVFNLSGESPKKDSLSSAIQSLDSLNDQIVQYIFTPHCTDCREEEENEVKIQRPEKDNLKSNLSLMRRLLVDAQTKFRKMVEENKKLAARKDGSIQIANEDMSVLRAELEDTNKKISQLSCDADNSREDLFKLQQQELIRLQEKNTQLEREKKKLLIQLEELKYIDQMPLEIPSAGELKIQLTQTEHELARAKEALTAMKNDRKRLKGEKVELLQQMKELYGTLEVKEEELRDFLRNYEYQVEESNNSMKQLVLDKEEAERDKWEILKRARDAAERAVLLREQIEHKDKYLVRLESELKEAKRELEFERSKRYSSTPREIPDNAARDAHRGTPGTTPIGVTSRDISGISGAVSPGVEVPDGEIRLSSLSSPAVQSPVSLAQIASPPRSNRSHLSQSALSDILDDGEDSINMAPEGSRSKSAEELDVIGSNGHLDGKRKKKKKNAAFGSLSKVFGRGKNKKVLEALVYEGNSMLTSCRKRNVK